MKAIVVVLLVVFSGQLWAEAEQPRFGERSIFSERAIQERVRPSAQVCLSGEPCAGQKPGQTLVAQADTAPKTPEGIYSTNCSACHASGAAGAPKVGDQSAWEARLSKGFASVVAVAVKGQGAMPPKGMCASCSDDDIEQVVKHMLKESGLDAGGDTEPSAEKATVTPSETADATSINGEEIYAQRCVVCHGQGVAGAPKVGVSEDWEARSAKGMRVLLQNAIKGFGAMPPRGTCNDCSDEMIEAAVEHMVSASQ